MLTNIEIHAGYTETPWPPFIQRIWIRVLSNGHPSSLDLIFGRSGALITYKIDPIC